MKTLPRISLWWSVVASLAIIGCGDDEPTGLERSEVVGSYQATEFTVTTNGQTSDLLANGASLDVTLAGDGTTGGRLFIPQEALPPGEDNTGDFDESLAGTWAYANGVVSFDQPADTFVRDMEFRATAGQLSGDETFDGDRIVVVLTKQ